MPRLAEGLCRLPSDPIRKVEGDSHTIAITARGIDCEHKLLLPVLLPD